MSRAKSATVDRHPIQVVVRRTGLSPDVIRVWERRYQAVRPGRSAGDRRLYTEAEIERLILLRRATLGGRSIGQVAGIRTEALRRLVDEDAAAVLRAPAPATPAARVAAPAATVTGAEAESAAAHLAAALDAVRRLDEVALERALSVANLTLSRIRLLDRVLLPLMRRVGDLWQEGALNIVHEHMAFAVVRNAIAGLVDAGEPVEGAPHLVVATPAGQVHELGALAAVAHAITQGWRVTYLGANLPADEIAAAARSRPTRAVALSLIHPTDDPKLPAEIRRLRRQLRGEVAILAGGPAAASYRKALDESGVRRLDDLDGLRPVLEELRRRPASG